MPTGDFQNYVDMGSTTVGTVYTNSSFPIQVTTTVPLTSSFTTFDYGYTIDPSSFNFPVSQLNQWGQYTTQQGILTDTVVIHGETYVWQKDPHTRNMLLRPLEDVLAEQAGITVKGPEREEKSFIYMNDEDLYWESERVI